MHAVHRIVDLLWLIMIGYWLVASFGVKRRARGMRDARAFGIRLLAVAATLVLINTTAFRRFAVAAAHLELNPLAAAAGLLVTMAGMTFAFWARTTIARNWGSPMSLKQNPELVTSGPYRWVRHPIYGGLLVAMLGSALAMHPVWFAALLVSCFYFFHSARVEEKLMLQAFPETYPAYMGGTKMFIPGLV